MIALEKIGTQADPGKVTLLMYIDEKDYSPTRGTIIIDTQAAAHLVLQERCHRIYIVTD